MNIEIKTVANCDNTGSFSSTENRVRAYSASGKLLYSETFADLSEARLKMLDKACSFRNHGHEVTINPFTN